MTLKFYKVVFAHSLISSPSLKMTCKNSKIDFFEEFNKRGLHTVLEKIILVLPLPALIDCIKVNKRWEEIVRFYNNSKNLKICQILEERKSKEWRRKKPRIMSINLEQFNIFQISCLHIIGDETEAIVASLINQTNVKLFSFSHFIFDRVEKLPGSLNRCILYY